MLNETIRPSTIGGIKRLAKQIKKAKSVPHHEALDIAARNAFFENFAHARNQLESSSTLKSGYPLFFTSYWYDRQRRKTGREVLEIELSIPLLELATKNELKIANSLGRFRLATPDLFVHDDVCSSQDEAIELICKAVRVLRFIEATGLKPSRDHTAAYPDREHNNRLPQSDHASHWYDPALGQFILVDEPYIDAIVDGKRAAWAKEHNWYLKASKWSGMYYPGMSSLFIATDASTGYDISALMAKIDNIPSPLTKDNWDGTSANGHETFFSPLCITPQDKKRAVAKGTIYRASGSKTRPMVSWGSSHNERRPNAVMPIESHQFVARLIKAIEQSAAKPIDVNRRLSSIKSKLEDWFFSEYEQDITDTFELFYYSGIDDDDPLALQASSSKGVIHLLQALKIRLSESYVDCEPLRKMMGKIDTSIKLTSSLQ